MLGGRESAMEGKSVYDGKGTDGLSNPKPEYWRVVVPLGETDIGDRSFIPPLW